MNSLLLRRVRVVGDDRLVDVSIVDGRVADVGRALESVAGVEELDLNERWLMPGLWDAHVHFTQWARHRARVDLSGSSSAAEAAARLVAGGAPAGVVVGVGFQDALWPDAPAASVLDAALARVGLGGGAALAISHDLHSVWLNAAAAAVVGAPHAGLLREADAFNAQIALGSLASLDPTADDAAIRAAVAAASGRGVVGIRDLEMADNPAVWPDRVAAGINGLRVDAGIYQQHLAASDARGWASGKVIPGTDGLVTMGPLKIISDGSLNTRTALTHEPYGTEGSVGHAAHTPTELAALLAGAKDRGLEVALHAIGDLAVTQALDAFEATGARGTIEHAQLARAEDFARFARLGIAASVQPQHAIDDRDVADTVWPDRSSRAFAYRSLHDAGTTLLLGSDAPVAPLDPWVTLAAAVHRSDDGREPWHGEQEIPRDVALAASMRSRVAIGAVGDVIAVEHDPSTATVDDLRAMAVALTVVGGRVTHSALG